MSNRTAETTEWVTGNLREAEHVTNVEVLSERVLRVSRDKHAPYVAGIVSGKRVNVDDIMPLVESELDVEIIVNVPKESYWTGQAIALAQVHGIAIGGYGDLL